MDRWHLVIANSEVDMSASAELLDGFANPPKGFGTIPWWIWNGRMEYPEMDRQLRMMKGKGLDGYMIWVRFGCGVEYLSRDYFQRVRFCVERSAELGLEVWFFDEYAWPSGSANNWVPRSNPAHRQRVLSEFRYEVADGQTIRLDLRPPMRQGLPPQVEPGFVWAGPAVDPAGVSDYTQGAMRATEAYQPANVLAELIDDDRRVERVIAVRLTDGVPDVSTVRNISDAVDGTRLIWTAPPGTWRVMVLVSRDFRQYIDALNPEAVASFIHHVHEKYKECVGEYFGRTVKGFFLDEPRIIRFGLDKPQFDEPTIPFTAGMFHRLAAGGFDVDPTMIAVFDASTTDEAFVSKRVLYWRTMSRWYRQSFTEQLCAWADRHGLEYMGDFFSEDTMILVCYGDYFDVVSPMHRPGLDSLHLPMYDRPEMYKGAKFASSVAHASGRRRCMAEGPGLLGYACDLEMLKRCTDWLYVLGVNQLVPNAFMYTISHELLYEPPSYFFHWTLWPHYDLWDSYVRRLSYILSQGRHVAPVALFYPTAALMKNYQPLAPKGVGGGMHAEVVTRGPAELGLVHRLCNDVADALLGNGMDFDYVDEAMLAKASADRGGLRLGDERFAILIVVAATVLEDASARKLNELADQGTETLWVGPVRESLLAASGRHLRADSGYDSVALQRSVVESVRDMIHLPVRIESDGQSILLHHRRVGDTDLVFLVNRTDRSQDATVDVASSGRPWKLDPATGERSPLHAETSGGRLRMRHEFAPYESLLLAIDPNGRSASGLAKPAVLALPDEWRFEVLGDNCLLLHDLSGSHHWTVRKAWQGIAAYRHEAAFRVAEPLARIWLMLDHVQTYWLQNRLRVSLNGSPLAVRIATQVDSELLCCDLGPALRTGENCLLVEYDHADYPVLGRDLQSVQILPPAVPKLRIMGSFLLGDGGLIASRPRQVRPGSWTELGLPFYSGACRYTADVDVPADWCESGVNLEFTSLANAADVRVNGYGVGRVGWRPWRIPVGHFLRPGQNVFEIEVTNTQANLFFEEPKPSGMLGCARLCRTV